MVPVPPVGMPTVGYLPAAPPACHAYPAAEVTQNWGLAYPTYATPMYAIPVPRPPRPRIVIVALVATYLGVLLSGTQTVLSSRWLWSQRDSFTRSMAENLPPDSPNLTGPTNTAIVIGISVAAVIWLLPATGAVVCAALAGRGRNGARIVLACLAGVFALNAFCGAGSGLAWRSTDVSSGLAPLGASAMAPWWAIPFQLSLAALAVLICVLLLLPAANRYFSAGAGRRFVPST